MGILPLPGQAAGEKREPWVAASRYPKETSMRIKIHTALMMVSLPLLLSSQAALGGLNGIDVKITNDGTENIVVTVYDTSTQPNSVVLAHQRINGFSTVPV